MSIFIETQEESSEKEFLEYYYRRGNKFFFRTQDQSNKLSITVSDQKANEMRETLKHKNTYHLLLSLKENSLWFIIPNER